MGSIVIHYTSFTFYKSKQYNLINYHFIPYYFITHHQFKHCRVLSHYKKTHTLRYKKLHILSTETLHNKMKLQITYQQYKKYESFFRIMNDKR